MPQKTTHRPSGRFRHILWSGLPVHPYICGVNFWAAALLTFLWSTVKYTVGVGVAFTGFSNPLWGFLFTTLGGFAGVVFFTYSELWLEDLFHRWFKPKRVFTKTSRRLVRLKQRGGLPLVALLTPLILSIPVGCLMATAFVHSRRQIIFWQMISVLFWGVLFFGLQAIFDLNLMDIIKGK